MQTSNESQIEKLVQGWAGAVRAGNIEGILAHHSTDIVMYDVPEPFQSVGINAYRKTWDLFFANTQPGVFDIVELRIIADEAVAFCFAIMECADKSDSVDFVTLPFRLTIGLRKIHNQWTIIHEHHSLPST